MNITTLHGDSRELLDTLEAESAQCVVTSPPYWMLRKYTDDPREIGRELTPAAFVTALTDVFQKCHRVLKSNGTLWIVIGDTYANDSKWGGATGGKHAGGLHGAINGMRDRKHSGLPDGNLVGIPWRLAFALQDSGWILRQEIIWDKPNAMPDPTKSRCTRSHETVFMFSKTRGYYYDAAAIAEPATATTNRGGNKKAQHLVVGKGAYGDGFKERWQPGETRNARSVWSIATIGLADEHYAPMPQALAERCIRASSAAGDTVLDPFGGSGTTGRAALVLQRSAVLIDLGYQDMQARRTDGVQVELFV